MAQFLKLLLGFAPWLSFMFIAQGSLFRLKLGLVVALALSVGMGVLRLSRGVIIWAGLGFFGYATVAVLAFEHMWTVRYMGILANGALALATWVTLAAGRPFTLDYAKDHVPREQWTHPAFLRVNRILTSAWGATFTIGALIAWLKMTVRVDPEWLYEVANYSFMLGAMAFTSWYPAHLKARRAAREAAEAAAAAQAAARKPRAD